MTALVVSGNNAYKPFSRDKLFLSVHDSLKHRKTALADATDLTDTIIGKLYAHIVNGQIDRQQIIHATSLILKRYDKVAATYYQAYHP